MGNIAEKMKDSSPSMSNQNLNSSYNNPTTDKNDENESDDQISIYEHKHYSNPGEGDNDPNTDKNLLNCSSHYPNNKIDDKNNTDNNNS